LNAVKPAPPTKPVVKKPAGEKPEVKPAKKVAQKTVKKQQKVVKKK
jgi:hypothetical protein